MKTQQLYMFCVFFNLTCSVMVSMLKLGCVQTILHLPFCDNPFRVNVEKSFPFFSLEGREDKIIAIYFFAFGNIYKTLILFNWKYCHVLVGMLHNVSKLLLWFASNHRFVLLAGDCYWKSILHLHEALCPPGTFSSSCCLQWKWHSDACFPQRRQP